MGRYAVDHAGGPADDAAVQAPGDFPAVLAFGNQAGHFGLGEYRAHAGDIQVLFSQQSFPAEGFDIKTQGFGHDFQKFSCPGGTPVVHFKFFHLAVLHQGDCFAVLAADIQHGPGFGEIVQGACGMGLDFGDGGRLKGDFKQIAAVPGGHDVVIDLTPLISFLASPMGSNPVSA